MKKNHDKKVTEPEKVIKDIEEEIVVEQESEIDQLSKKALENLSGWQRCQADFENYKKRSAESQKDLVRYATQSIILEILPVIDNFHASTDHIPAE